MNLFEKINNDGAEAMKKFQKKFQLENVVDDINEVTSFHALYEALKQIPGQIEGGHATYDSEELMRRIEQVRKGQASLTYVTRTYGIRDAVEKLLERKANGLLSVEASPQWDAIHGVYEKAAAEAAPISPKISPTDGIIANYLAYQDTNLPEDKKAEIRTQSLASKSAHTYAQSLLGASKKYEIKSVEDLAHEIRETMLSEAVRLGISVSSYGQSITWAMWDLGKQYYYFQNPDKNTDGYALGNPFEQHEKQDEIINRHLGWEAYNRKEDGSLNVDPLIITEPIEQFLSMPPKSNGTLSSKSLAQLGEMLRKS